MKDYFVMAQGAYMTDFNQMGMSMSLSKAKALPMEQADAEELASTIAGACAVRIDGSDVMSYPNILDIFRQVTADLAAARLFGEKLKEVPSKVADETEKVKALVSMRNKLIHRASFDPGIDQFWEMCRNDNVAYQTLMCIATAKGMMIVSGVDN